MKFMGDLPFLTYFDFETTSGKKIYNSDDDGTLYPVSNAFVVPLYQNLNNEKISFVRSFNHTFERLNDVRYLSNKILLYFDPITARQLKDCALAVQKGRFSLSKVFSCEIKFVIDILKKWLAEKYFRRFKEFDIFTKKKFEKENPINWDEKNCVICGFRLPTAASNFPNEKISMYLEFAIAKEHAFIRNIFDHDELKQSKSIKTYEKYHESFREML